MWGIRFTDGGPKGRASPKGWLLDPMTQAPKRFNDQRVAYVYARLSFNPSETSFPRYMYKVEKLK